MSRILSDVAKIVDSLHKTPTYQRKGFPMVRIVDVNNNFLDLMNCFRVDEKTCDEHNKNHIPQMGDIIITRVGSYGMLAYVNTDEKFCLGQNIAIISPKENKKFIYYYLKSPYIQNIIYGNSGGSSYKCISLEEIKKLPYYDEGLKRDKIGDLLYSIDSKIENNNRINVELESMAKTIYDYWFLQFEFPNEEGKPYKSSGGKMVWNEELKREIPVGWQVDSIGEYVDIIRGISYSSEQLKGSGIPLINLNSFNVDATYKAEGLKIFSGMYSKEKIMKPYDLVICMTQQTSIDLVGDTDVIGKTFLVPDIFEQEDIVASMDVAKIEVSDGCSKFFFE